MAGENQASLEKLPHFSEPRTFISPQISSLLQDQNHLKEEGIAFQGKHYRFLHI